MVEALLPQVLSTLIGSIYDCALAPDRWEGTLAAIRDAFSARTAILSLVDRRHGRLLLNWTVGIEPYQMEAVARHTPEINARTEEALASAGVRWTCHSGCRTTGANTWTLRPMSRSA